MTKQQMIRKWLSPSTCGELPLIRKLNRIQKFVILQIYDNESLSNNQRRKLFYECLKNPACMHGQPKYYILWNREG